MRRDSVEDKLQALIEMAKTKRVRYSEVQLTCEAAIKEIERLRELEFMYQGLCT